MASAVWNSLSPVMKRFAAITAFKAHPKTELFFAPYDAAPPISFFDIDIDIELMTYINVQEDVPDNSHNRYILLLVTLQERVQCHIELSGNAVWLEGLRNLRKTCTTTR